MAIASGIKTTVEYTEEATQGVTPGSPTMQLLRATGRNINLRKSAIESAEPSLTRQTVEVRQGFNQTVGELGFELTTDNFNDMFRFLLGGSTAAAWTAYTAVGNSAGCNVTAPSTITRTSGNWITDGYRPGDWLDGSAWTTSSGANNQRVRITSIAGTGAGAITVDSTTLVTEAAAVGKQFVGVGKFLKVSSVFKTFTLERAFTDLSEFQVFRGCTANTCRMSARPDALLTGSFGILGLSALLNNASALATPVSAIANSPMATFEASVIAGGSLLNAVTAFDMLIDNQRGIQPVVGSKFSPEVFDGTCKITGTFASMFQNDSFMVFFENETTLNPLQLKGLDPNGDFIAFSVFRPKFTGHEIDPPTQGPVLQQVPWQATLQSFSNGSTTFQEAFRIQRSTST